MLRSNVAAGCLCLAFGALVFWLAGVVSASTFVDPLGGRFFPRMIAVLFMAASAALIVTGMMGIEIAGGTAPRKGAAPRAAPAPAPPTAPAHSGIGQGEARQLGFLAVMVGYTFAIPMLGYVLSSLLVFGLLIAIAGERRPLRILLGSAGLTGGLYLIFAVVLGMNLPQSTLF